MLDNYISKTWIDTNSINHSSPEQSSNWLEYLQSMDDVSYTMALNKISVDEGFQIKFQNNMFDDFNNGVDSEG